MHTTLRKIGNSKGIIIPAHIIEALHIDNDVDMFIENGALVLKPTQQPRQGWFENYDANKDDEPLAEMTDLESEQEDWEW
ncbi:AbrB/MazE/SpoVT family DNA-binding domain-containing protein [Marinomonas ostreistagni]|uniref:AbrB/MazE/SpoVT family DNA-binding domain-containing protein n=1 Tax=Marinomonas ostreistagni TaxID=359209 RepID=UPI0019520057|nr:AbrB/MazE/SpoVT family DNA-binding domain-containing protein [Marinomonas ostreistagni]MBM6552195.1 hypothetical protein [Marinomonas ostreistagni]